MNTHHFLRLLDAVRVAVPPLVAHLQAHPVEADPTPPPEDALWSDPHGGLQVAVDLSNAGRHAEAELRYRTMIFVLDLAREVDAKYLLFLTMAVRDRGQLLRLLDRDEAALPVDVEATRLWIMQIEASMTRVDALVAEGRTQAEAEEGELVPLDGQVVELAATVASLGPHLVRIGQASAAANALRIVVEVQRRWSETRADAWPRLDASLNLLAEALEHARQFEEAEQVIQHHLVERRLRGSKVAPHLVRLSRVLRALERPEEALAAADEAVEQDPSSTGARYGQIEALSMLMTQAMLEGQIHGTLRWMERLVEVCRSAGETDPDAQAMYEDLLPQLAGIKADVARLSGRRSGTH